MQGSSSRRQHVTRCAPFVGFRGDVTKGRARSEKLVLSEMRKISAFSASLELLYPAGAWCGAHSLFFVCVVTQGKARSRKGDAWCCCVSLTT